MIISFLNEKGGVGKSTITANLASLYSLSFDKVLIVDTDKQGSLRDWHSMYADKCEKKRLAPKIDIIAADTGSSMKSISSVSNNYDIVLIDGAGKSGLADVSIEAIKCSDLIIIPVQPANFDLWGSQTIYDAALARQELTGKPDVYFLFNRVNCLTEIYRDSCKVVAENKLPCLETYISQRVAYSSSTSQGDSILNHMSSKGYIEINCLADELIAKLGVSHLYNKQMEVVA